MNNCYQDWKPVVIRSNTAAKKETQQHSQSAKPMGNKEFRRLDTEEIPKLNKITREQAQAISTARNALKLTQKELAQKLRIPENTIKEYENCTVANFSLPLYKRILKGLTVDPKLLINEK
jgi:ribosome-binding protein aMBF1 (putative translation factor)